MKWMVLTGALLDAMEKIQIIFVLAHTSVIIYVNPMMEVTFYNDKSR